MALIILAIVGCLLIAAGVTMIYLPAGLIVTGALTLAAVYVARYFEARRPDETARASR